MGRGNKITEEQVAWVAAHLNDRPRAAAIRASGLSARSFYRLVRRLGGEFDYSRSRATEGIEEAVRELFPHMSCYELAARLGTKHQTVLRWAHRLGVEHTEETRQRIAAKSAECLGKYRHRVDYRASARKRSRMRRMDELRVLSGLPQRTRYHIRTMPARHTKARWRLSKLGYTISEDNPYVLLYDGQTHRCREKLMAERYGFKFRPVPQPQPQTAPQE